MKRTMEFGHRGRLAFGPWVGSWIKRWAVDELWVGFELLADWVLGLKMKFGSGRGSKHVLMGWIWTSRKGGLWTLDRVEDQNVKDLTNFS